MFLKFVPFLCLRGFPANEMSMLLESYAYPIRFIIESFWFRSNIFYGFGNLSKSL